jgi:hypothetical protein
MTFGAGVRRRLQQLGPYKSLGILLIPLILVEPAKMAGVAFMGLGHWVGGACLIVGAYAAGLLVVDRLFRVVKSKLYTIRWCATLADSPGGAGGSSGRRLRPTPSSYPRLRR